MIDNLSLKPILDGLGHGVLIFAPDGRLIFSNHAAARILHPDLQVIQAEGWMAARESLSVGVNDPKMHLQRAWEEAESTGKPQRFYALRAGEYVPCWVTSVPGKDSLRYPLLTLDVPDWSVVGTIVARFREEMQDAIESTVGHINLIRRTLDYDAEDQSPEVTRLARRIGGFTRLIATHMSRAERLIDMLQRLEDIRTGALHSIVMQELRQIDLNDFIEDLTEELDEIDLLDPDTDRHDYRSRLQIQMPRQVVIAGASRYLAYTLRELLRNAIMYSLRGTPIHLHVQINQDHAQIDVRDEGYGIRQQEWLQVFEPFARGRQPQVMSEFGYGLGLYLCKQEIKAMNGQLWFNTEENVGTTFSVNLPLWSAVSSSSSQIDEP